MKKTFTLLTLLFSLVFANAQVQGPHLEKKIDMASLLKQRSSASIFTTGFSTVSEARTIINDIMDVVNYNQNFQVMSTSQVPNAAAVMYNGTRYILYNPTFINQLDNVANERWASISVLAHEIGHHLLGHTMDGSGDARQKELNADKFSGMAMAKMGASLQQAQLAMKIISDPYGSSTHPGSAQRLAAIAEGYNGAGGRTNDVAVNNPTTYPNGGSVDYPTNTTQYPNTRQYPTQQQYPNTQQYPQQRQRQQQQQTGGIYGRRNQTATQSIVYDIRFTNGAQYYITSQNNVVKANNNNRLQVVAKIAASNNRNYPYIIYDDQTQLLVDARGTIYSDNGRKVGTITQHV